MGNQSYGSNILRVSSSHASLPGLSVERALGYQVLRLLLQDAFLQKFARRDTPPSRHRSIAHVVDQCLMYARSFSRFRHGEIQSLTESLDLAHDQLSGIVVRLRRFCWRLIPPRALFGSIARPVWKVAVQLQPIIHAFTDAALVVPIRNHLWLAHTEYGVPF